MLIDILLWILIGVLVLMAFFFVVVPVVPAIALTLTAALIYVLWQGVAALGLLNFWLILGLGLGYFFFDLIATLYGAKKFGASRWGLAGAILGGIGGALFGGPLGIILGTLAGAALFEYFFNKENARRSLKVGAGAAIGFLVGSFGKLIIVTIATILLIWGIFK